MSFTKSAAGFTLVEILLVISISVAAMAVVGPKLASGNQASVLKAAVRDLASALRYARGHALTTHEETTVAIDLEENSYQVSGRDKLFKLNDEIDITLSVAQQEQHESGAGQVRFFPDGSSSGGRIVLELSGLKQTVDVNWLTGQVEINAQDQDAQ